MNLRKAIIADAQWILDIRNHKVIRKLSNNPGKINLEQHLVWFQNKLNDSTNICIVSEKVWWVIMGYCRLDYIRRHQYLVSIAISPDTLSRGLGSKILKYSLWYLKKWDIVTAEILGNNIVSIAFFRKFWFREYKKGFYQLKIV